MKRLLTLFTGLCMTLFSIAASADVLLLVHGYMGNANSWLQSGVVQQLDRSGWTPTAVVSAAGTAPLGPVSGNTENPLYLAELSSLAPLQLQTDELLTIISRLQQRHPDQNIRLVGHSAGGIVSRLAVLRLNGGPVTQLVTIASPHLGTPRAIDGLEVADDSGPIGILKSFFGGNDYQALRHSQLLLTELTPIVPGHPLFLANQSAHPDIQYISIIHTGDDNIVPSFSQDMNQVTPLRGKSHRYIIGGPHVLFPGDGTLLSALLTPNV